MRGGRSDLILGGLCLVAIANGVLLGLTFYALLAAALKVLHGNAASVVYAWVTGAIAGGGLLVRALQREQALREGEHKMWTPFPGGAPGDAVARRFRGLVRESELERAPALGLVESRERNAFAVGRSSEEATIVLTRGLLETLPPVELDAVLAQQLAQVEDEDLKAVGLADAIADSVDELAQLRGRFLWGPRQILTDLKPLVPVYIAMVIFVAVAPASGELLVTLTVLATSFALLRALWIAVRRSWRGLGQLFLYLTFLGPLSLVEAALSPPTAAILARLVSRARVHEADARAVWITHDREALLAALRQLEAVERSPASSDLACRRFSLFITTRPQSGYRAWLAHIHATHPSVASRIETIEAAAGSRPRTPA